MNPGSAVAPNCMKSPKLITVTRSKSKMPVLRRTVLDEAVKIIKSWPSNVQLLFCVMKWGVHTIGFSSLLLHSLCGNVTLVKYMKKLWLCTNGKGKRISNSFFTSAYGRMMTVSRKSTCAIVAVVSWTTCLFHGSPGWLESTTDRWTMVIQPCGSGRHFLAYEHSEPVTSRKTPWRNLSPIIKFELSSER